MPKCPRDRNQSACHPNQTARLANRVSVSPPSRLRVTENLLHGRACGFVIGNFEKRRILGNGNEKEVGPTASENAKACRRRDRTGHHRNTRLTRTIPAWPPPRCGKREPAWS